MRLGDLAGIESDSEVTGFAIDHRKVVAGQRVRRVPGARFNGEDFIAEAVRARRGRRSSRGPRRRSRACRTSPTPSRGGCSPSSPRKFFAPYPETIVAVTGTNGKTSTVEMTRQLWRMAGHRSASIGTLGVTTPTTR